MLGHDVGAVIKQTSQLALLESAAHPPGKQANKLRGHIRGGLAVSEPKLARTLDNDRPERDHRNLEPSHTHPQPPSPVVETTPPLPAHACQQGPPSTI